MTMPELPKSSADFFIWTSRIIILAFLTTIGWAGNRMIVQLDDMSKSISDIRSENREFRKTVADITEWRNHQVEQIQETMRDHEVRIRMIERGTRP